MNKSITKFIIFIIIFQSITSICKENIVYFENYDCLQDLPIGSGSNGTIYLVQKKNQRFILKSQSTSNLSEKELSILKKLKGSWYVTQLVDFKRTASQIHIIMSYGFNGTLLDFIQNSDYLDHYDNIVRFFFKLFVGLEAIHTAGYVHADLKLENIMVDSENQPMIMDFDLAVPVNQMDLPRGTLSYMPPEIFQHFILESTVMFTTAVDVYSLSVLFYQIVKGKKPFEIDVLDYNRLLNQQIDFSAADRTDFYEYISQTLVPLSHRISFKSAKNLMEKMHSNLTPGLLGFPWKYTLRQFASENEQKISSDKIDRLIYSILALLVIVFFAVFIYFILFYIRSKKKGQNEFDTKTTSSEFMTNDFATNAHSDFDSTSK